MSHITCMFWTLVLASLQLCEGYRILVAFPFPSKSHSILGFSIATHLLDAGHDVTYITVYPQNNPNPRFRQVDISFAAVQVTDHELSLKKVLNNDMNRTDHVTAMLQINYDILKSEQMQRFLNDPNEQFDLVIVEWMMTEFYVGLAAVFNCPYIWFSSGEPHSGILRLVDESSNPAFVPNIMSTNFPPFTFRQRIEELLFDTAFRALSEFFCYYENEEFRRIYEPITLKRGNKLPEYRELRYNASLVLANSHPSIGQAISLPQNYKYVGGYHIDKVAKPLPEDLKKIMDGASYGLIYFSMGTNLNSKSFPNIIKRKLLKLFGKLKQTVLWKFEEPLPDLPKNVHIIKWAPQQSILSHPNCILFITHGGLLSNAEAVYSGVPLIGIPIFADQFNNINRAVNKGYAKKVDFTYSLAEDLEEAIKEILVNLQYRKKVQELSVLYHDRPVSPGKELVHWVEHVVKTQGAPHLRSPALMVPWYQKMFLDLIAVMLTTLFGVSKFVKHLFFTKIKPKIKLK